ncbi:acetyltransferase [Wenjunlia vitaminophila]|uniref:Acetyltransferase n=1 Tax=Wenjunlia vitaminophila TaxID=76728 RepID=A0A0T6LRW3_WENVI|nr:GNAT family N-acetyltransferase [Wenjunlia vitaminophila]KRV48874.1 acetyltransferase [Wenjunlia vitaminophila]
MRGVNGLTDPGDSLLAIYDNQLRGVFPNPSAGVWCDDDGPLLRVVGQTQALITGPQHIELHDDDLRRLITRQRDFFAERGLPVEWRTHRHDEPASLPSCLESAGFTPGREKTVLVGRAVDFAREPAPPPGVVLRRVAADHEMRRIAALASAVWGGDWTWLGDHLIQRIAAAPDETAVLVAEADGEVVAAAWLVYRPGTDFAGLRGGSTLAPYRGRGIYRSLIAARAQLAAGRGVKYLQVDASDESAPILRRLGFCSVTTTTPYLWTPSRTTS